MKFNEQQIKKPCVNRSGHTDFLGLAKFFYNDRFDTYKDGYSLAICPWLNGFGVKGFQEAFKPADKDNGSRWFDSYRGCGGPIKKEEIDRVNDHRVFALLFMHELHKDYLENYYSAE
jgi:hypothetical protein